MQDKLKKIYDKKQLVQLQRTTVSRVKESGFVLGHNAELVLIQNCDSFTLDGYTVVRMKDISAVRSNKFERFFEKMLKGEGTYDEVGIAYEVDLDSWQSLLRSLQKLNKNVIIECEVGDEEKDEFYIGKLIRVNRKSASLLYFSAVGEWDEAPTVIPFDEITKVQFDDKYIQVFSKYLK
jgi:hypothetical protein